MARCEKCKSSNLIETENGNYCCNCGWDSVKKDYIKRQTNADRIRSMSDEELAEFLIRQHACENCEYFGSGARCKAPNEFKCTNEYATAVVQKWLKSEVKGSE